MYGSSTPLLALKVYLKPSSSIMLFMSFLTQIITGVEVRASCSGSDPIECPLLKVEPEHINVEDFVRLRCEAERGEQCHFYTDQSPEPFRTVLNRFNVCQLSATGRELLGNKTHVNKTEVFLSCAAEMIVGDQRVISEQSEVKKVEVVVNFGQLHLQVDPKHISTEDDVKVRCEVEKGTRCHFYMGQSDVPFRSELYRREYRVCLLTVSGRELLQEMGNRTRAEVSLSCAVELDIKGQSVSSHHSESIRIKVEGLKTSDVSKNTYSRISTSGSTVTTSNSVTTGIGQHLKFILPVAVVLFLLMSAAILGFHTLKHKRNKPDSKSDLEEHRNNSSELAVYATVNKEQPQTAMQLEDVDTDVCYATVKQSKHPNKSAQTLQLSQKCEYATVMMH